MRRLSSIVTVSLGVAVLITLVYAKDRSTPLPGVRTAIELVSKKAQVSLTLQHTAVE
ncbi:MAG: hypothetical protein K8F92_00945 [Hyphomicrobium sp.]|uniref:hypothetical protein n=1 Tax=Hyphomicrobium sp. TaxID=82 RepID=UPI0022CC391D|nr:hypothetical protein [Hyphomicrobium sp.]MBZ0208209.1 hypothetical protein [Hyphomicrobium sp.]MCZ7594921.1 hypothetical protein [Hyphomicrobium sp.]